MDAFTFVEFLFYVMTKVSIMVLGFCVIWVCLFFKTETKLEKAATTMYVIAVSIFLVYVPFMNLVYLYFVGEAL